MFMLINNQYFIYNKYTQHLQKYEHLFGYNKICIIGFIYVSLKEIIQI